MNITEKYGKPLLSLAAITLSSTAAYCSTWSFITDIIGKLDANPAAIKTLDAPNVKAQKSLVHTAVLEPTADSKFAAVARPVGIDDVKAQRANFSGFASSVLLHNMSTILQNLKCGKLWLR